MDAPQLDVAGGTSSGPLPALPEGVLCPECGYDLRGSISPRCSECGHDLAVLRTTESQIPWVHRRQIGRIRAYWRTGWLVTFRNRQFCAEAARPVSYTDAQRFRWVTVMLAYVAILAGKLVYMLGTDEPFGPIKTVEWLAVPIEVGTYLALAALTGIPSYLFHPRRAPLAVQNRAVALSYYACGPLSLLAGALLPLAFLVGRFLCERWTHGWGRGLPLHTDTVRTAIVFGALALPLWWLNLVRIAARVLRHGGRTVLVAATLPLLWIAVAGLILVGLPAVTFYIVEIVYSLR